MTGTNTLLVAGNTAGVPSVFNVASYEQLNGVIQSSETTETKQQQKTNSAVTFSLFAVRVSANTDGTNRTVQFRKNTGNGNQVVTITASSTGYFKDITHSDSLIATDLFNIQRPSDTNNGANVGIVLMQANNTTPIAFYSNGVTTTVGHVALSTTTQYAALFGFANADTTETNAQVKHESAGTLKNLSANLDTSSTGTTTITHRKNTANGNQTLSISSGTTGITQDTTHTDSLSAGDLLATSFASTNSSGNFEYIAYEFAGTTSAHMLTGRSNGSLSLSGSSTYNHAFCGNVNNSAGFAEGKVQLAPLYSVTASKLRCHIQSNTTATATMVTRSSAVTLNQTVSVASGGTGQFEDTTHTDSLTSASRFNAQIVTGSVTSLLWLETAVTIDDGSNTGASTETGTGVMSLAGVSYVSSGADSHTSTGIMALSGVSYVSSGNAKHLGSAIMALAGVSYASAAHRTETGTGAMALLGVAYNAAGKRGPAGSAIMALHGVSFTAAGKRGPAGSARMSLSGVSFLGEGFDVGTPGQGVRQFWTF